MDCSGALLCGVLTIETGLGPGAYGHAKPAVHGLWPQVGEFGTSPCIAPKSTADPTKVYSCYVDDVAGAAAQLTFEVHEWEKHGTCAGVTDATDFFNQVCKLSGGPIGVVAKTRSGGATDIQTFVNDLNSAGFDVWDADDYNMQPELSACAGADRKWKLAKQSDFATACGGGAPPGPPAPPGPQCQPGQHGPQCSADADCTSYPHCVRCASSGFCTDAK